MNVKTLLVIACGIATLWKLAPDAGFARPPLATARAGNAVQAHDFAPLFDAGAPLASLARDGVCTVVEVYINTCATCKQLEAQLPAFLARRNDVVDQRVHCPDDGTSFSMDQALRLEARMNAYRTCGTPHLEIYDPRRRLVSRDACGDKAGLGFLRRWMALEHART